MANLHPTLLSALTDSYVREAHQLAQTRRAAREAAAVARPAVHGPAVAPAAPIAVPRCRPA